MTAHSAAKLRTRPGYCWPAAAAHRGAGTAAGLPGKPRAGNRPAPSWPPGADTGKLAAYTGHIGSSARLVVDRAHQASLFSRSLHSPLAACASPSFFRQ